MSCKEFQEKILEMLAAGVSGVPHEVGAHLRACGACREFQKEQATLFRSMEEGLQILVNQPAPPSLLPRLRVRLQDNSSLRRSWVPAWSIGVAAAVAVLVLGLVVFRHQPLSSDLSAHLKRAAVEVDGSPGVSTKLEVPVSHNNPRRKRFVASARNAEAPETQPQVIVLAEEREAFARFVAVLPEERAVAIALSKEAPGAADIPVEIALLQIASVEVKPMEGTPRE